MEVRIDHGDQFAYRGLHLMSDRLTGTALFHTFTRLSFVAGVRGGDQV